MAFLKGAAELGVNLEDDAIGGDVVETPAPPPPETVMEPPRTEAAPEHKPTGDSISIEPATRQKSRRELATERVIESRLSEERERFKRELAERDERNARTLDEIRQHLARPAAQQPAAAPGPADPDPGELRRKARKALDEKDFDEYERLSSEAIKTEMRQDTRRMLAEQAKQVPQAPPQMPPYLVALLGQSPNVARRGQLGIQRVIHIEQGLALDGMPPGPEREAEAFRKAEEYFAGQQKVTEAGAPRQQFSQSSASVLSGVPTKRGAASGSAGRDGPGVTLTGYEKQVAKRFKMSELEYAQHLAITHPERIER